MRPPAQPLFLARQSYRRRRLIDALRLVPVLGALLFTVPVLGASGHAGSSFGGALYLFLSWALLILLTALLSRRLARLSPDPDEPGSSAEPGAAPPGAVPPGGGGG